MAGGGRGVGGPGSIMDGAGSGVGGANSNLGYVRPGLVGFYGGGVPVWV